VFHRVPTLTAPSLVAAFRGRDRIVTRNENATTRKPKQKEVDISKMPREEREAALQEAKLLASLRHPNIVACVESFVDKKSKKLCIVQEYCAGGDVHERLR
jgi:serine/threonine protein kinase